MLSRAQYLRVVQAHVHALDLVLSRADFTGQQRQQRRACNTAKGMDADRLRPRSWTIEEKHNG